MSAPRINLVIERGATFAATFAYSETADGITPGAAWDLTGFTARIDIRGGSVNDAGKVSAPSAVVLALSTAAGSIAITPLTGEVAVTLTPTQTRTLATGAALVYDLRLYGAAGEERPAFGTVTVLEEITVPS